MSLKTVRTPLIEVAYEEHGRPDAHPVLLLHGWPDDIRTWDRITGPLADAGFRVLVPYLRGFGPTTFLSPDTPRAGQLSALGQDTIDFADALNLSRFSVVGHDWGARAAAIATSELQHAGRIAHLILVSVGYGTNDPSQKLSLVQIQNYWYHWYMAVPRGLDLVKNHRREFTRYMWDVWTTQWKVSDAEFEATAQSFENPDWFEITIHSYRHRWGHAEGDSRYADLERRLSPAPQITVPTLILHGADDPVNHPSTSEGKEKFFTGSYSRKLVANSGHFPQRAQPVEVATGILRWLQS